MNLRPPLPIWERLLRRREIAPNGCWLWTGYRDAAGYGRINNVRLESTTKTGFPVHRLVAHLVHSLDLDERNQYACHHCDNPPCFNPDHVFVGTPEANQADCMAKGRWRHDEMRGELNGGGGKLTEFHIVEIRKRHAQGEKQRIIAADYGIDQTMVSMIVLRKKWSHVA